MKILSSAGAFFASTLYYASVASAMVFDEHIVVQGNKFFYNNNGSQFYIKGVTYQPIPELDYYGEESDPLSNYTSCLRDLPMLQDLGVNVIRVYDLNVSHSHKQCLSMFEDNDIYVMYDFTSFNEDFDRDHPTYDLELQHDIYSLINEVLYYSNTLGFIIGNGLIDQANRTAADAYIKGALADAKEAAFPWEDRYIPVGYAANDLADIRVTEATYFACGDPDFRADFYALNFFEWCSPEDTYESSGYELITNQLANLSIPLFFSQYGCSKSGPRQFTEVQALYGSKMNDIWSGGFVHPYIQREEGDGALVIAEGDTVVLLEGYSYLSSELAKISPTTRNINEVANRTAVACPTVDSTWLANSRVAPPPEEALCACMVVAAECGLDSNDEADYQNFLDEICETIDCTGIRSDGTSGEYGFYSGCKLMDRLRWALQAYYEHNSKAASACDFSGRATIRPGSTARSCTRLFSLYSEFATEYGYYDGRGAGPITTTGTGTVGSSLPNSAAGKTSGSSVHASSSKVASSVGSNGSASSSNFAASPFSANCIHRILRSLSAAVVNLI